MSENPTGRSRGSGPRMQGIVPRTPEAAALIKAFVSPDHPMVTADYAEMERIALAHLTPEERETIMASQRKAKGE